MIVLHYQYLRRLNGRLYLVAEEWLIPLGPGAVEVMQVAICVG